MNQNNSLKGYTPIPPPTPPLKGEENVAVPALHPPFQGEGWGGDGLNLVNGRSEFNGQPL